MKNVIYDEESECCGMPVKTYDGAPTGIIKEIFYFSCIKCKNPCRLKKKIKKKSKK